jgi:hypothetical protein
LGRYASVYLLGIQLLGVLSRFGHRIATLLLSRHFLGWQPEVFDGNAFSGRPLRVPYADEEPGDDAGGGDDAGIGHRREYHDL